MKCIKMTYNNQLPNRKHIRLKDCDYSTPGYYFITVCTKDKKSILCNIVGTDVLGGPQVEMFKYGKIAEEQIKSMSHFYDNISVDKYVIMPNHIHFILKVTLIENGPPRTSVPTNNVISNFIGTFKRLCNRKYGKNIWQFRSHDHIIRDENDYQKIWEYIDGNPARWSEDKLYVKE